MTKKISNFAALLVAFVLCQCLRCEAAARADSQFSVRVAISDGQFKKFSYDEIEIMGTKGLLIRQKTSPDLMAKIPPGQYIKIKSNGETFTIILAKNKTLGNVRGPIVLDSPGGFLGIKNLKRCDKQALYRGKFEITRAENGQFFVINSIDLENYLAGVVPNEMPAKFGLEALKAQAIAARNYAIVPRVKAFREFDVFDSVASQVYFGANTEHPNANRAVKETEGLVVTYDGSVVITPYFSSSGGCTENYENVFSDEKTKAFPSTPKPHLIGRGDDPRVENLKSEMVAAKFYKSFPNLRDVKSKYFRWKIEWSAEELETILQQTLAEQVNSGFVRSFSRGRKDFGKLKLINVIRRGISGKIIEMEIVTSSQKFVVQKELVIRSVLKKGGSILPSANVVFDHIVGQDGKLVKIIASGGGFGHGVGMSQYGAEFMATQLNRTFDQILKSYYTNISIGTIPAIISSDDCEPKVRKFYAPKRTAALVVSGDHEIHTLSVKINGKVVQFNLKNDISKIPERIDISKYVRTGENHVEFFPPKNTQGWQTAKLHIEFF
ncbi:MAG: SpoIID/LytB domain-containing protein [Puniceicoccales bacterium]|jgi:SpoIID/LytB domain protein|nr:SpoIID/LytB domain-containing protein [Puniceicoccales bacterium]